MFLLKRSKVRLITSKRKQTGGTIKRQGSWLVTSGRDLKSYLQIIHLIIFDKNFSWNFFWLIIEELSFKK